MSPKSKILRKKATYHVNSLSLSYGSVKMLNVSIKETIKIQSLIDTRSRVGNFRQKTNSAEDGIGGTNGYFRWNSGCSTEEKISEFRSEPFRDRENNSEFRSVKQK